MEIKDKERLNDLETFEKVYNQLPIEQQLLLQMMTLLYTPVSKTSLINCVKSVKFQQLDEKLQSKELKEHVLILAQNNLISSSYLGQVLPEQFQNLLLEKYIAKNPSIDKMIDAVEDKYPLYWESYMFADEERYNRLFRDVRNSLVLGEEINSKARELQKKDILSMQIAVLASSFTKFAFDRIPKENQPDVLIAVIHSVASNFKPMDTILDYLFDQLKNSHKKIDRPVYYILLIYLVQGNLDAFDALSSKYKLPVMPFLYLKASALFMRGKTKEAGKAFA